MISAILLPITYCPHDSFPACCRSPNTKVMMADTKKAKVMADTKKSRSDDCILVAKERRFVEKSEKICGANENFKAWPRTQSKSKHSSKQPQATAYYYSRD